MSELKRAHEIALKACHAGSLWLDGVHNASPTKALLCMMRGLQDERCTQNRDRLGSTLPSYIPCGSGRPVRCCLAHGSPNPTRSLGGVHSEALGVGPR